MFSEPLNICQGIQDPVILGRVELPSLTRGKTPKSSQAQHGNQATREFSNSSLLAGVHGWKDGYILFLAIHHKCLYKIDKQNKDTKVFDDKNMQSKEAEFPPAAVGKIAWPIYTPTRARYAPVSKGYLSLCSTLISSCLGMFVMICDVLSLILSRP